MANESGVFEFADSQMIEMAKDFFLEGMVLPVPVYFRMNKDSYLLIGRKGDKTTFKDLQVLRPEHAVIHVKALDHTIAVDYVMALTGKVVTQKTAPDQIKTRFLNSLTEDALKTFHKKGFASVAHLERVSSLFIGLSKNIPGFDSILQLLMELPEGESHHSMATCMVSLAIAEEMQVTHLPALEKLALGALLHDVGLKTISTQTLQKPRHMWSNEELMAYEQHPIRSVELLRDFKDISADVLIMIVEHHENSQGTGFPKKIRDVKISPLGKILILGNYFASLLFAQNPEGVSYTADAAIDYIESILGQPFNKQAFLALKNIVNKRALSEKM